MGTGIVVVSSIVQICWKDRDKMGRVSAEMEDRWWTEAPVRGDCWLVRTGEGLVEVYRETSNWFFCRAYD
jgi:hypothetical protein